MEQLKEQQFSLNNTAENLKDILCIVGGLPAFPEKLHVMEVISEASRKMKEVADLIEGLPSKEFE